VDKPDIVQATSLAAGVMEKYNAVVAEIWDEVAKAWLPYDVIQYGY
jgi:hypothetical protein